MAAAPPFRPKLELMDAARMARTLSRIAYYILAPAFTITVRAAESAGRL